MVSILLVAFAVQLFIYLVSSVGAQRVNDAVWFVYSKLAAKSKQYEANSKLRAEVVRLQREMSAISAQDNFAKWARLRREHDKAKEQYDKASREQQDSRKSFDSIVSKLRWVATQGINFGVNSYYGKEPMFWLPQGWVPYTAEWILSFPKAPLGSISINVWGIACASMIGLIGELILASWTLVAGKAKEGPNGGKTPKLEKPIAVGTEQSKKEL